MSDDIMKDSGITPNLIQQARNFFTRIPGLKLSGFPGLYRFNLGSQWGPEGCDLAEPSFGVEKAPTQEEFMVIMFNKIATLCENGTCTLIVDPRLLSHQRKMIRVSRDENGGYRVEPEVSTPATTGRHVRSVNNMPSP